MLKIFLGSDHAGLELKNILVKYLEGKDYAVTDMGPEKYDRDDDFPDYAKLVCERIIKEGGVGILVCGSGQGMTIAANKFDEIRAALCLTKEAAIQPRDHLDANVLCLGAKLLNEVEAEKIVDVFLKTPFSKEERHQRRIGKLKI